MPKNSFKQVSIFLTVMTVVLFSFSALAAGNGAYDFNYGQVSRLYPSGDRTYFRLTGGRTAMNPKNGYYYILTSHSNYEALVNLLYLAAEKRWKLYARTKDNLDSRGFANVDYLVADI